MPHPQRLRLRRVVLGVTGGIAAYKAAELTRLFVKAGVTVDVVMTEAATPFVTPITLPGIVRPTGAHGSVGLRRRRRHGAHRAFARRRRIVVAPASADFHRQARATATPTISCRRCASRANARCSWRRR